MRAKPRLSRCSSGLGSRRWDAGPGDPAGSRGAEEGHHFGHLLGAAETAHRDLSAHEVGDSLRVSPLAAVPTPSGEPDRARRDTVDADVVLRQVARHRLGEADLRRLRHVVGGAAAALPPPDRRHQDDDAAATGAQLRQGAAAEPHGRPEILVQDGDEVGLVGVGEAPGAGAADVVDQDVQASELGDRARHQGLDAGRRGDVQSEGEMRPGSGAVQLALRGAQPLLAAGADRHPRPLAGQRQGDRSPQAPAAPTDDRSLARQLQVHAGILAASDTRLAASQPP